MQTEVKRVIISVDRKSYELEQKNYIQKIKLEDAILKEVYHLLPDVKLNEISLFSDVLNEFHTLVELTYKDKNTLRLKGFKLAELLEINTSNLKLIANEYEAYKGLKEANIENFCTYVDNEAERERFILCKKVVNCLNEVSQQHQIYGQQITQGFNHLVTYDIANQNYLVNISFIKNLRY